MAEVHSFTFNDFQENTFIVYDETKDCVIIDPGCNNVEEQGVLTGFISEMGLNPVRLLNTHCHIDHILGNRFVAEKYGLDLEIHAGEKPVLESGEFVAKMYGIAYNTSPEAAVFLKEGTSLNFGKTTFDIIFAPGHSPASICFYCKKDQFMIGGDVLFYESIGRTDLPGGDHETLLTSIRSQLFTLPDDVVVYPGHGPETTIGHEKKHNPFL